MKFFVILLFSLLSTLVQAQGGDCLPGSEARVISIAFRGISLGTHYHNKWVCKNDIDSNTFTLLKVLQKIREVSHYEGEINSPDDLDVSPIQEYDMWSYLKNRVRDIKLPRKGITDSSCRENVTANARRTPRTITLCSHFFSGFNVNSLAATIMHEVRHFDDEGHPHVACASELFEGLNACDRKIHDQGAYSAGLQTLVRLAKSPNNTPLEKYEIEARALYQAYNKFNVRPDIHLSEYLILSKPNGDIYKKVDQNFKHIGSLPPIQALAFVKSNAYNSFVVIPQDKTAPLKRFLPNFKDYTDHSLILQTLYNDDLDRDLVLDIDYTGTPALLTNNQIISNCRSREITRIDLADLRPKRMIDYLDDSNEQIKAVLMDDGSILSLSCLETTLQVTSTTHTLSHKLRKKGLIDTATINNKTYALVADGSLLEIALIDRKLVILRESADNHGWSGLTKYERPVIFE